MHRKYYLTIVAVLVGSFVISFCPFLFVAVFGPYNGREITERCDANLIVIANCSIGYKCYYDPNGNSGDPGWSCCRHGATHWEGEIHCKPYMSEVSRSILKIGAGVAGFITLLSIIITALCHKQRHSHPHYASVY
jgi:hypothetical protein